MISRLSAGAILLVTVTVGHRAYDCFDTSILVGGSSDDLTKVSDLDLVLLLDREH